MLLLKIQIKEFILGRSERRFIADVFEGLMYSTNIIEEPFGQ
jgi:hypothetical protein